VQTYAKDADSQKQAAPNKEYLKISCPDRNGRKIRKDGEFVDDGGPGRGNIAIRKTFTIKQKRNMENVS